ncbi:C39 family peptidase [Streptomyces sp. NPDC004232]|uniref:C39 family peptidase n=1 Tax=Streptomyces sp. NPDC004232 TaxID=3154454 RepID=UPI0033AB6A86
MSRATAKLRRRLTALTAVACLTVSATAATVTPTDAATKSGWYYAPHPDLTQSLPYNCVPTAASMALASMGVHLTPADLGRRMHLVPNWGVNGDDLMRVYNQVQPGGRELMYEVVTSARQVEADLSVDLLHHVAVPALVIAAGLPWQGGEITGHAVVVDGLNPTRHLVRVFDPAPRNGGEHVLTTDQLLTALQMKSGVRHLLVD